MNGAYRTHVLITGFIGQLKGWWDVYLTSEDKEKILNVIKLDADGESILQVAETISNVVATLIFTIAKIFIGDPGIFIDKSLELLNNLNAGIF